MSATSFRLVETMRWEDGLPLLDRHLARLSVSAAHFGLGYREHFVLRLLHEASGDFEPGVVRRLRLTLGAGGALDLTLDHAPLVDPPPRRVLVYPEGLEMTGPFFRHKTTARAPYERALAWAQAHGADEAILVNPRGEAVEATRANVWIERGGRLLTPPPESGGLPGVYRAHLLATRPDAAEAPLPAADLLAAEKVWLSNAVRGLFAVEVVSAGAG